MSVVIGELIEHNHAERGPQRDEIAAVVLLAQALADEARLVRYRRFSGGYIRQSPRRPEMIHVIPPVFTIKGDFARIGQEAMKYF
jgi:hypothetical protein